MAKSESKHSADHQRIAAFERTFLTEAEFAKKANLHVQTVQRILNGGTVRGVSLKSFDKTLAQLQAQSTTDGAPANVPSVPPPTPVSARTLVAESRALSDYLSRCLHCFARDQNQITEKELREIDQLLSMAQAQVAAYRSKQDSHNPSG